jgi:hypothetical protein
MNTFSWSKAFGFGVLIWAIMAIALWILSSINGLNPLWTHGIVAVMGAVAAYFFGRSSQAEHLDQAVGYGFSWAVMVLLLDLAVTQWFDAHIFNAWQQWMSYALILLAPLLQVEAHQHVSQNA